MPEVMPEVVYIVPTVETYIPLAVDVFIYLSCLVLLMVLSYFCWLRVRTHRLLTIDNDGVIDLNDIFREMFGKPMLQNLAFVVMGAVAIPYVISRWVMLKWFTKKTASKGAS